jgi:CHAD domain-containing protein
MAFRLKGDQPVSNEIRRIVVKQLERATTELKSIGDPQSNEAIHAARRRIKKIRAVIRLIEPVLNKTSREADKRLRDVNRMLAPVADGHEIVETLKRLGQKYGGDLGPRTLAMIRAGLIEREERTDRKIQSDGVLQTAADALRAERKTVGRWRLTSDGFDAIRPGLEESFRQAQKAMTVASDRPTARHYHSWRRHVKDHWFQVRLLEGLCDDQLEEYQIQLEALDGTLGEYHNLALLRNVLMTDGYVSRQETAGCLRATMRYQRELRRHAHFLGARVYAETPRRFVQRVRRFWRAARSSDARAAGPWRPGERNGGIDQDA